MPLGKTLLFMLAFFALTGPSSKGAAILEDPFSIPPNTVGSLPSGWTVAGEGTNNDFIDAANLTFPGLADGTAGSWKHDGSQLQRYYRDFSPTGLVAGQLLYYSFLLKVDSLGKLSTNGYTSGAVMLGSSTSTAPGNGTVAAFSFRKDFTDSTKFNMGVSHAFRGTANTTCSIIGLDTWAAIGGTTFSEGQTLFLVAEYSYTTSGVSTVRFWINPDPGTFGAAAVPSPTLGLEGKGSYVGVPVQRILVSSVGNTSSASGFVMKLDAFRFGNTWADVTPKGGPVSFALMDRTHRR